MLLNSIRRVAKVGELDGLDGDSTLDSPVKIPLGYHICKSDPLIDKRFPRDVSNVLMI